MRRAPAPSATARARRPLSADARCPFRGEGLNVPAVPTAGTAIRRAPYACPVPPANNRNDVAQRRRRLRELDVALCSEMDDAGSLTFGSLRVQVADRALLATPASDETLWEWWHYAQRRRIVEPAAHGEEMCLSDRGRARLEEAERDLLSPSAPKARAVMRYVIPPGLTGVVVVAAENDVAALLVLTVVAIALLLWLEAVAIDWIWGKWFDPRARPAVLRKAVAWLEGDEVRLFGRVRYPAVEHSAVRRLPTPPLPNPPSLPEPPTAGAISSRAEATTGHAADPSPSSTALISSTDWKSSPRR